MKTPQRPSQPETRAQRQLRKWGLDVLQVIVGFTLAAILEIDAQGVVNPRWATSLDDVSVWVSLFWPLVIVFFALWYLRYHLTQRFETKSREAWLQPVAVWHGLQRNIRESLLRGERIRVKRSAAAGEKVEAIRAEIRLLLSEVLALVEGVEPRRPNDRYAVNVMRRFVVGNMSPEMEKKARSATLLDGTLSDGEWQGLESVLYLDPELSTSSAQGSGKKDKFLKPLTLLVPFPTTVNGRKTHLPGAPEAAVSSQIIGLTSEELIEACKSEAYACDQEVVDRLVSYFRGTMSGRVSSFVSFPVAMATDDDVVAVLNVHSDHDDLLRDESLRDLLYYLLRPLILALLHLLEGLEESEGSGGAAGAAGAAKKGKKPKNTAGAATAGESASQQPGEETLGAGETPDGLQPS